MSSVFSGMRSNLSPYVSASHRLLRIVWRSLREWCGDAAYECYLRSATKSAEQEPPLTPEEFYVDQLNRRYSRPNRCC